ncbi:hypothetical protein VNO77_13549 [Canavalia gladiata]|uniref:Uncharacterized protein n=1 Tax=Canavalia gladiata TaxID=3824 RepID=A0AAN9M124_CANGL
MEEAATSNSIFFTLLFLVFPPYSFMNYFVSLIQELGVTPRYTAVFTLQEITNVYQGFDLERSAAVFPSSNAG